MSAQQLWLAVVVIVAGYVLGFYFQNRRIDDLRDSLRNEINGRFADIKDLFRSEVNRLDDLIRSEVKRLEDLIRSEVKRLDDRLDRMEHPVVKSDRGR